MVRANLQAGLIALVSVHGTTCTDEADETHGTDETRRSVVAG